MVATQPYTMAEAHVFITGGGSGIGKAIAQHLDGKVQRISLLGRREAPLASVAGGLSSASSVVVADVTSADEVRGALDGLVNQHGPVTVLINNAGAALSSPFSRIRHEDWQAMLNVNLTSAFHICQALLPGMCDAGGGRVINMASTAGLKGYAYTAHYVAAKHGLVGLTRALAVEVASRGVTVNAVCPGFTETPLLDEAVETISGKTGMSGDEARATLAKGNPQGRLVQPDEVASAVGWLCSDQAGSVTGQVIPVTGGEHV